MTYSKNYFKECKTLDEAKLKYRELVKKLHPDLNHNKDTTKEFQDLQNQFENFKPQTEKFEGEFSKWDAKEYAHIINQLLLIDEIEITICGSWIWISGNTYDKKEAIKAINPGETMKRGFSSNKQQWYFSPTGYKKRNNKKFSFDQIQEMFGSQKVKRDYDDKQKLNVA